MSAATHETEFELEEEEDVSDVAILVANML
jgi:hypothetical protein